MSFSENHRLSEYRVYNRSVLTGFAIMQANMSDALVREMSVDPNYNRAINAGDLLAMLATLELKVICGSRIPEDVVTAALRSVTNPHEGKHRQKDGETDKDYILRFQRLVSAAHKLRAMNGSALTEDGRISGFCRV